MNSFIHKTPTNDRTKTMWLIGSLGVDRRKLNAWRRLFHGGVFVEPHMPELREFREHFLGELQVSASFVTHLSPFMERTLTSIVERATRETMH